MNGLKGKSIIVTGGGSGIGRATALMLGAAGCQVSIADVDEVGGEDTAAEIAAMPGAAARYFATDVADDQSVARLVEGAVSAFGGLYGAVNAAGVPMRGKRLHELSNDEWDLCCAINLRGAFLCMKHQITAMLVSGGGSIVAIGSTASMVGIPRGAEYCATKSGILGLVRAAALDYAANGVRINAILPGGTQTPMLMQALELAPNIDAIIAAFPMRRLAQPAEIAATALWLLSDQTSYITGVGLPVDGGMTAA